MGQKVNPIAFRTGTFYPWKSRWFSDNKNYKNLLLEDVKIREYLMDKFKSAGIEKVEIERLPKQMSIIMIVSRPGVVIGRGGSGIEEVSKAVKKIIARDTKIDIQVQEIKNPDISAQLIASKVAFDLERRMPHRRVVRKAMDKAMESGAKGIKIVLSGRIQGAEISRVEKYHQGSVPTQTLRKNIDYAQVPAALKRGYVGIKVWVHKPLEK